MKNFNEKHAFWTLVGMAIISLTLMLFLISLGVDSPDSLG